MKGIVFKSIFLFILLALSTSIFSEKTIYSIKNDSIKLSLSADNMFKIESKNSIIDFIDEMNFFIAGFEVSSKSIMIQKNDKTSEEIKIVKNCVRNQEHIIITERYILKPETRGIIQICEIENKTEKTLKDSIRFITRYSSVIPDLIQSKNGDALYNLIQYYDSAILILPDSAIKKSVIKTDYGIIYYDLPELLPGEKMALRNTIYVGRSSSELQEIIYTKAKLPFERVSGKVFLENSNLKTVGNIPVMAYEEDEKRLISICYSDENGEYGFMLPDDSYSIKVDREPYKLVSKNGGDMTISMPSENEFIWYPFLTDMTDETVILNFKLLMPSKAVADVFDSDGNKLSSTTSEKTRNLHHIEINGLKPGEEYSYIVRSLDSMSDSAVSESCSFRTIPKDIDKFAFVNHSDTQLFYNRQKDKSDLIMGEDILFVTHSGDLTENGPDEEMWKYHFDSHRDIYESFPVYPSLGNHERNSPIYYDAFDLPDDGGGDFNERWYAFEVGDTGFIVLDSNILTVKNLNDQQTEWLKFKLNEFKDKCFTIVYYHHPFWTNNNSIPRTLTENEKEWRELFEQFGVDLVMNGHIHAYEHFSRNGIEYITTGGGGAKLDNETGPEFYPWTVKTILGYYHYALIEIDTEKRELKVTVKAFQKMTEPLCEECYTEEFRILDEFTINR